MNPPALLANKAPAHQIEKNGGQRSGKTLGIKPPAINQISRIEDSECCGKERAPAPKQQIGSEAEKNIGKRSKHALAKNRSSRFRKRTEYAADFLTKENEERKNRAGLLKAGKNRKITTGLAEVSIERLSQAQVLRTVSSAGIVDVRIDKIEPEAKSQ